MYMYMQRQCGSDWQLRSQEAVGAQIEHQHKTWESSKWTLIDWALEDTMDYVCRYRPRGSAEEEGLRSAESGALRLDRSDCRMVSCRNQRYGQQSHEPGADRPAAFGTTLRSERQR